MLAKRIDTDGKRCENLGGRQNGVHTHADNHDQSAGFVKRFRRQHIKDSQHQYQHYAGQLPEKLGNAAPHFAHADHFGKEVVEHSFV